MPHNNNNAYFWSEAEETDTIDTIWWDDPWDPYTYDKLGYMNVFGAQ